MVDENIERQNFNNKIHEKVMDFIKTKGIPINQLTVIPALEKLKWDIIRMVDAFEKKKSLRIYNVEVNYEPEFDRDGTEKPKYTTRTNFINEPDSTNPGEVGEPENSQ